MTPFYSDDWLTILAGDCRTVMAEMEPESVQCVVTSPPYFGLRDYGIEPSVWGGEAHEHEWGSIDRKRRGVGGEREYGSSDGGVGRGPSPVLPASQTCLCGAWLGVLGLEPTVDCGRPLVKLRSDLTPKQLAYVTARLKEAGLVK
jgi:hypothetical protein